MEAIKEPVQEQKQPEPEQAKTLGNKVPNSFEELNAMRQNQNQTVNSNQTHSTLAQNGNTILQSSTQYKSKEDPVKRFAKSMNLPKDTCTVKMPKNVEKTKYEIPPSEYIWDAPYLKKTQIFPSYVRKYIFLLFYIYRL